MRAAPFLQIGVAGGATGQQAARGGGPRPHAGRRRTCRYCEMNTGSIYNDCDVPQELTDQQIDQIHEEQVRGGLSLALQGACEAGGAGAERAAANRSLLHGTI